MLESAIWQSLNLSAVRSLIIIIIIIIIIIKITRRWSTEIHFTSSIICI